MILVFANIITLIIAFLDESDTDLKATLGNIIIGCFFAFTICSLVFLALQLLMGLIENIHKII